MQDRDYRRTLIKYAKADFERAWQTGYGRHEAMRVLKGLAESSEKYQPGMSDLEREQLSLKLKGLGPSRVRA